jgi:hypothetical protein
MLRNHIGSLHTLNETWWRPLRRVDFGGGNVVDVRRDELDKVIYKFGRNLTFKANPLIQKKKTYCRNTMVEVVRILIQGVAI